MRGNNHVLLFFCGVSKSNHNKVSERINYMPMRICVRVRTCMPVCTCNVLDYINLDINNLYEK